MIEGGVRVFVGAVEMCDCSKMNDDIGPEVADEVRHDVVVTRICNSEWHSGQEMEPLSDNGLFVCSLENVFVIDRQRVDNENVMLFS